MFQSLRDFLNPTDDHEGKVLTTYPLKTSFLIECLNPNYSWEKRHLSGRVVSVLNRVYEEGKAETLTHPFVRNEPLFTKEDKSYHEAQRILNELVTYSKSHHRSLIKNWILTCVIFVVFLADLLFKYLVYPLLRPHDYFPVNVGFGITFGACLMTLMSVTTCFDVPCCWRFGNKKAKFSMFRNLHIFRLVLLVSYLVISTAYAVVTIYCVAQQNVDLVPPFCAPNQTFDYIYTGAILTIAFVVCSYVLIMLVIINKKCCCYKNRFRPVLSCRNLAHEKIIIIDICHNNNKNNNNNNIICQ